MMVGEGRGFVPAADKWLFSVFRAVWCGLLVRLGWRGFHLRRWGCSSGRDEFRCSARSRNEAFGEAGGVLQEEFQEILLWC